MDKEPRSPDRILAVLCVIVYSIAVTGGAFAGGMWASLGIGLAFILFITVWAVEKKMPLPARHFFFFALAALALFGAELLVSSNMKISSHVWLQLVSIFIPLSLLTSDRLQRIAAAPFFIPVTASAAMVGAIALGAELQSGGVLLHLWKNVDASLTEYNRGMAHLAILAFPLVGGLWISGNKYGALGLALLFLFPASLTESHTAKLALIVGAACTVSAFYRPRWIEHVFGLATIFIMGWPFFAQALFTKEHASIEGWHSSWRHRMEIWDYLSYRIEDRPLLGWGLGTTHTLDYSQPHGEWYEAVAVHGAPHAHNFITEIWVEAGCLGLALGLGFLFISLKSIRGLHRALQPFAYGCWIAALTIAMFGFDFWTDSLWAAFALSMFAFGVINQRVESSNHIADIKII